MSARFKAGDRVAYVTRTDAYLGTVDQVLLNGSAYFYHCVWDDGLSDPDMRAEDNFREVH